MHRRFNETVRFQFHFAFQRRRFMRLSLATIAGSHAHKKRKHQMFIVNAQSKRSLRDVYRM